MVIFEAIDICHQFRFPLRKGIKEQSEKPWKKAREARSRKCVGDLEKNPRHVRSLKKKLKHGNGLKTGDKLKCK